MKVYVIKRENDGCLLCSVGERIFVIDDYSGNVEPGDCIDLPKVFSLKELVGKYEYTSLHGKGWIHVAGEI